MADFFPQERISDPSKLFGRESDLRELINATETKTQLQIIGARRFGKTTISLCLETILRHDKECNVYPIYTDVKKARIKGTADFYRYITAKLINRLSDDKVFCSRQKFGMVSVRPNCDYLKVFSDLKKVPDNYMDDLFVRITKSFAEKLNKTILIIFDEFEYLAKSTFYDNLEGFYPLRDFSTDRLDSGLRPFFFWLVGARPWGSFVRENRLSKVDVIGGSGEFNGVEIEHYLSPIDKDAFLSFWQSRCNEYYGIRTDELEEKEYLMSLGERVYDSVSGVPFYGSAIAKHIKSFGSFPDYTSIKSHLDEAIGIFDGDTLSYMRSLCSTIDTVQNDTFKLLERYGFARISDDGKGCLTMGFLRDYLINKIPMNQAQEEDLTSSGKESVIAKLIDSIDEVIEYINETCRNKSRPPIFGPTEEDRKNREVLKRVCSKEEDFGRLLETLAKVYYERSKAYDSVRADNVPGHRLAELEVDCKHTYKSRQFFKVLEPLRTYYAAHLRDKVDRKNPYQIEKGQALEILQGHKNEPETPDQWYQLQKKLLQIFKMELNTVKQKVMNLT